MEPFKDLSENLMGVAGMIREGAKYHTALVEDEPGTCSFKRNSTVAHVNFLSAIAASTYLIARALNDHNQMMKHVRTIVIHPDMKEASTDGTEEKEEGEGAL